MVGLCEAITFRINGSTPELGSRVQAARWTYFSTYFGECDRFSCTALHRKILLWKVTGRDVKSLGIVCMPHTSPGVPNVHSTVEVVNANGKIAFMVHVGASVNAHRV
ncbi:hypothetical protein OCU04_000929 [Sclerotinia nivalis]|uniref:Uncharacterized protein n=1 Tax=Sclerotinia nivalis TaxID=352851 RepID=A0A9X0AXM1_9HELO|nr:hypothetical protein OCU04_000929 [Sclerotinia nivalis]